MKKYLNLIQKSGIKTIVVRLHQIYGMDFILNNKHSIISKMIHNYCNNDDLTINNPKKVVSFCEIKDAISAIMLILEKGQDRGTYDVIDRNSCLSLEELKDIIYEGKSFTRRSWVSELTSLEDLGWRATTNMEEAIANICKSLNKLSIGN